jgi:hypothetical protein
LTTANRSYRRQDLFAALSLIVIDLLVYGPFLRSLGFSHDDWPVVSVFGLFGHDGVRTYFTNNRPLSGWLTNQLLTICGVHPLGWHLAMLVALSLTGVATFFAFRALWPHRSDLAWLTAALVLLYPGFTQHSESLIFLPIIVSLLLFVLSLWATIASLNSLPDQSWPLTGLALVLALSAYGLVEYFLGLELFRLMVIAHRTRGYGVLRKAIAPYLVAWVPFVIYKGFIMHGNVGNSYRDPSVGLHQIAQHPLAGIIDRIAVFVHNIIFSVGLAWVRPIGPQLLNRSASGLIVEYGLGLSVAAVAFFSLRNFYKGAGEDRSFDSKLGLAIGAVLVSGIPLLISGLRVQFDGFPSFADRLALPFMLSAAFVLAVVLTRVRSAPLIGGLLCLLTVFQVQTQLSYAHDWSLMRSLYWQEVWRAPMLKPGTAVYLDGTPKTVVHSHNAGMLDLLYGTKPAPETFNYYIYDLEYFHQPNLKPGSVVFGAVREFQFHGMAENSLVQWLSPNGVLHTVDQSRLLGIRYTGMTDALAFISAPSRVIEDNPLNRYFLLSILGKEPPHDWSYYYQRAELKAQEGDWAAIATLGDSARQSGYQPVEGTELFPFIEGYALGGRYEDAANLTEKALSLSPEMEQPLSTFWSSELSHFSLDAAPPPGSTVEELGEKLELSQVARDCSSSSFQLSRQAAEARKGNSPF